MLNKLRRKKKDDDKPKKSKKSEQRRMSQEMGIDDPFKAQGTVELQKPADQLDLTEAEKKKEHTRILTATNPHAPDNIIRFSFKDAEYKQIASVDQLAVHFALNGNLIHKEGDEARRQLQREERAKNASTKATKSAAAGDSDSESDSEDEEGGEDKPAATTGTSTGTDTGAKKVLRNQFNFSERAAQTFNNPYRHREEQTEPPPRAEFSGTVNQWRIFDAYEQDIARQEKEKEKAQKKGKNATEDRSAVLAKKRAALEMEKQQHAGDDLRKVSSSAKVIERMVNQNTFSDISDDFRYFDDESDQFREGGKGTLLPLWKFYYEATSKLAVTSVAWFDQYSDMMAVGNGSFNFSKQGTGALIIYSLKNPSFPEYFYETESGIMTIDIHPQHPHYVCCGLYNGDVCVYNLKSKSTKPEFISSDSDKSSEGDLNKHTDPVWQVKWQPDNLDSLMNFCSISSDGKIGNWVLVKNELMYKTVVSLKNVDSIEQLDDPRFNFSLASGTAFAFHPENNNLFLAGTEEGKVFKSYQSYTSRYLDIISAHNSTIETIEWSPFHPNVFMTCSQDWTVKIWDHEFSSQPLFVFELKAAVGSCCWSYHSSTVFAAVTIDGKAHIFDLSVNKYEALAEQQVSQKKKTKLTSVSFNKKDDLPILLVGDDRGHVSTFKLSPNLRKIPKQKKGVVYKLNPENERAKLDKIVELERSS